MSRREWREKHPQCAVCGKFIDYGKPNEAEGEYEKRIRWHCDMNDDGGDYYPIHAACEEADR